MIRTVVFDIGRILVGYNWRELLGSFGFSEEVNERLAKAIFQTPLWLEFDRGVMGDKSVMQQMKAAVPDLETECATVFSGLTDFAKELPYARPLIMELKEAGYQVLLLSNYGQTLFGYLCETASFLDCVDGMVISYREKFVKPQQQIYQILLERYHLKPEETLFIDDKKANIIAARDLGLHAALVLGSDGNTQRTVEAEADIRAVLKQYQILGAKDDFTEFADIIRHLRAPDGCPWDREQTHASLKSCMKEEAYEVLDGIEQFETSGNTDNLVEELGDVLLQVVMHAQIGSEEGLFDIHDIIAGISRKMVRRHPHVFGDTRADDTKTVLANWEEIKKQEKSKEDLRSELEQIPKAFPALLRAQKVLKKLAKKGNGWTVKESVDAVSSIINEIQLKKSCSEEQLATVLLHMVNIGCLDHFNCEDVLAEYVEHIIVTEKER